MAASKCRRCGQRILLERGDGLCERCRIDLPRARNTDPDTSHEAAASVRGVSLTQSRIETLIRFYPGSTDEDLIMHWNRVRTHGLGALPGDWGPISVSSLRTRRHELAIRGLIAGEKTGTTEGGRACYVWKVIP